MFCDGIYMLVLKVSTLAVQVSCIFLRKTHHHHHHHVPEGLGVFPVP